MYHVATMKPEWKLIGKILSGQKSIESRWYQTKRAPWDKIQVGDIIYFKDSGKAVTAKAEVVEVMQFELNGIEDASKIVKKYGNKVDCFVKTAKWLELDRV